MQLMQGPENSAAGTYLQQQHLVSAEPEVPIGAACDGTFPSNVPFQCSLQVEVAAQGLQLVPIQTYPMHPFLSSLKLIVLLHLQRISDTEKQRGTTSLPKVM